MSDRGRLLYDADCGLCRRAVERWRARTGDRVEYMASEGPIDAVQFLDADGERYQGAEAVFRALGGWRVWAYGNIPGFAPIGEAIYRFVARNRSRLSTIDELLNGAVEKPPTYIRARSLFLALLGVVYLIAFVSLWGQIHGLVGGGGIFPAQQTMDWVRDHDFSVRRFPTVFWLGAGDTALGVVCALGVLASLSVISGFFRKVALTLCWLLYLSLFTIGLDFLSFQWDTLLLETGFLAILFAPWRKDGAVSTPFLWLLRYLLFRLMFASAMGKLASDDPSWWELTALEHHYLSQPLPTWLGYYADRLPSWIQSVSVAVMFFIEGVMPFFIFCGRRLRVVAFFGFIGLMVLIGLTGNYGFFNLLAVTLSVLLLDDRMLRRKSGGAAASVAMPHAGWRVARGAGVALMILVTLIPFSASLSVEIDWPGPMVGAHRFVYPLHLSSGYGLFKWMTKGRNEIEIEGSQDGVSWEAYVFKYKPGPPARAPVWVQPHMPRLDWQMWFAALSRIERQPWLSRTMHRLLENSPEVVDLFETNPFPDEPPRFVRAMLYRYSFTDAEERENSAGDYWKREKLGLYSPVMSR